METTSCGRIEAGCQELIKGFWVARIVAYSLGTQIADECQHWQAKGVGIGQLSGVHEDIQAFLDMRLDDPQCVCAFLVSHPL
jgi:hypothetical protein